MRWAMWSASALLLATVSFAAGRFSSFRPFPEIVATLPGDESEFSREFDGRIRERFPIGSSEDKLLAFLANENFFPDWRRRDNPNSSFFVQSGTHMPENRSCVLARRRGRGSHGRPGLIRKPVHMIAFSRSRKLGRREWAPRHDEHKGSRMPAPLQCPVGHRFRSWSCT